MLIVASPRRLVVPVAALLAVLPGLALSTPGTREPWEEFDKRVTAASTFATLGPDAFGDNVNLSNGALSFNVTDVVEMPLP